MTHVFVGLWAPLVVFKDRPDLMPYEAWIAWAYCHTATIRRSATCTDPMPEEPRR